LLAKQTAQWPTALVVMAGLDFVEVEDLARVGVHAFLTPDVTTRGCIEYISAAAARVRMWKSRGAALVPMRPDAHDDERCAQQAMLPDLGIAQVVFR
jgi:hypothetical protein